jgi:hypothetical protein
MSFDAQLSIKHLLIVANPCEEPTRFDRFLLDR